MRLLKLNRIVPIDPAAVQAAAGCSQVFFFEEGVRQGGIGERFGFLLQERGFAGRYFLRALDDPYIPHAPMFRALEALGLNAQGMAAVVLQHCAEKKGAGSSEKTT